MSVRLSTLAVLLLLSALAQAAELPAAPVGRVNDLAGVLQPAEREALEGRLAAWEQQGAGPQIAVVTLPSLGDAPIDDVSIRLAERWKIGSRADDGVLVVLAPKERKVRIEVGYGLEGRLPDALAGRIIAEIMATRLRGGDYAGGLTAGAVAVHQAILGQPVTGQEGGGRPLAAKPAKGRSRGGGALAGGGGLFLMLLVLLALGRRGRGGGGLLAGLFLGSMFGGRRGGGGGGGGFSGGGGSFGGGGASGDY